MAKITLLDTSPTHVNIDTGTLPIPSYRPQRKQWFQLIERDWKERIPVDRRLIGKEVKISQFIVRTGYYFQHMDVDDWSIRDITNQILIEMFKTLFGHRTKWELTEEQISRLETVISRGLGYNKYLADVFGGGIYNRAQYKARKVWLNSVYELEEYKSVRGLRTFWYVRIADTDPDEFKWVKISETQNHMLGWYCAPYSHHYSGPDGDDYDYDPGGLNPGMQQAVYKANSEYEVTICRNYWDHFEGPIEIHPLDVLEVR